MLYMELPKTQSGLINSSGKILDNKCDQYALFVLKLMYMGPVTAALSELTKDRFYFNWFVSTRTQTVTESCLEACASCTACLCMSKVKRWRGKTKTTTTTKKLRTIYRLPTRLKPI